MRQQQDELAQQLLKTLKELDQPLPPLTAGDACALLRAFNWDAELVKDTFLAGKAQAALLQAGVAHGTTTPKVASEGDVCSFCCDEDCAPLVPCWNCNYAFPIGRECWQRHLRVKIQESGASFSALACCNCKAGLPESTIADLVAGLSDEHGEPLELLEALRVAEDRNFSSASDEWAICTNPRCGGDGATPVRQPPRIDPRSFTAGKLAVSFRRVRCQQDGCFDPCCADCHAWGGHDPLTCQEWRDWQSVAAVDSEKASLDFIRAVSKQCPSCGLGERLTFPSASHLLLFPAIFEEEGCNHMVCGMDNHSHARGKIGCSELPFHVPRC